MQKIRGENKNTETQSLNSVARGFRDFRSSKDNMDDKAAMVDRDNMEGKTNMGDSDNINDLGKNILACRCMEISENAVRVAIRQGANTVDAVKRATMAGMGLCQSKTCFNLISRLISEETKIPLSQIMPMKIRIPVRPVKINSLEM